MTTKPRYTHSIGLNEEQERRLKKVTATKAITPTQIFHLGLKEAEKNILVK